MGITLDTSYSASIFSMSIPTKYWIVVPASSHKKFPIIDVSNPGVSIIAFIVNAHPECQGKLNIPQILFINLNAWEDRVQSKVENVRDMHNTNDMKSKV